MASKMGGQGSSRLPFRPLFLILAVLVLGAGLSAEPREFKSVDGRTILADLIEVRMNADGVVVAELRRSDRRYFEIPLRKFSPEDRKFLEGIWEKKQNAATMLTPESRIDLNLKLNRKTDDKDVMTSNYTGSVWKDRKLEYTPEVVIKNDELVQSFEGNTIRVVVIAKAKHENNHYLIACAATKKADFPAKGEVSVFGHPFYLREYEYDSGYNDSYNYGYGYEKDDYVILVMNRAGEVTHTRASSKKFLDNLDKVMKCKAGEVYSEGLEHKVDAPVSSSHYQKGHE